MLCVKVCRFQASFHSPGVPGGGGGGVGGIHPLWQPQVAVCSKSAGFMEAMFGPLPILRDEHHEHGISDVWLPQ